MKTTKKSALLLLSFFTVSPVIAFDGQITFEGDIADVTCEVTGGQEGGGNQGSSFTVIMPKAYTVDLSSNGARAGKTNFYLLLSGAECADGKTANVVFEGDNINSTTGYLDNEILKSDGGAENIQIVLSNNTATNSADIDLRSSASHQPVTISDTNTARFDYSAQYHATAQSVSGDVRTIVGYSISYN